MEGNGFGSDYFKRLLYLPELLPFPLSVGGYLLSVCAYFPFGRENRRGQMHKLRAVREDVQNGYQECWRYGMHSMR